MPRRTELPTVTRNILIYEEDWDFLSQRFGAGSLRPVGAGPIIREIVHRKVQEIREKEREAINQTLSEENAV